jgi:hypothetical protein
MSARAFRMHHALRNTLTVEVRILLEHMQILKCQSAALANRQADSQCHSQMLETFPHTLSSQPKEVHGKNFDATCYCRQERHVLPTSSLPLFPVPFPFPLMHFVCVAD